MKSLAIAIDGVSCIEEAVSFFISQVYQLHGKDVGDNLVLRGHRRVFRILPDTIDEHVRRRTSFMSFHSPVEVLWLGPSHNIYVVYGLLHVDNGRV